MSIDKCTPGKWWVRFFGSGSKDTGDNDFFVEAPAQEGQAYGIEIMMEDYGDHNNYPRAQRLADAKLIAASKDMYEALTRIINDYVTDEYVGEAMQKIAKQALPKL